jgi:hypothetical protein
MTVALVSDELPDGARVSVQTQNMGALELISSEAAASVLDWNGAQQTSSNTFVEAVADTWVAMTAAVWTVYNNLASALLIDIATGVMTYGGPALTFELVASLTVSIPLGSTIPADMEFVYDQNATLLGTTTDTSSSQLQTTTAGDAIYTVTLTQIVALAPGDTLQLLGRNKTDNEDITVINVNVRVRQL